MRVPTKAGSLVAARLVEVGVLGHGLEVGTGAVATFEGGIGLGVQSVATKTVKVARQDGRISTHDGSQKGKAEANSMLGGEGSGG